MAVPASCVQALNTAQRALQSLPGLSAVVLELDALLLSALESEGFALIAELTAIYKLVKSLAAKLINSSTLAAKALNQAGDCVLAYLNQLRGTKPMACATTHKVTSNVQGPGPCCAALSASGLAPAVGVRVVGTNKAGKCIVCEITTSRSPKHPGMLVFKRGKASVPGSSVSCPSTAEGCCALIGQ